MNHAITVEQAKLLIREGEGLSVEQTRQNTAMIPGVKTRVI